MYASEKTLRDVIKTVINEMAMPWQQNTSGFPHELSVLKLPVKITCSLVFDDRLPFQYMSAFEYSLTKKISSLNDVYELASEVWEYVTWKLDAANADTHDILSRSRFVVDYIITYDQGQPREVVGDKWRDLIDFLSAKLKVYQRKLLSQ